MRAVAARVQRASVTISDDRDRPLRISGAIGPGLLVLLGVHRDDVADPATTSASVAMMARKLHELRLLRDELSCADSGAPLLVVSQFTLHGDTRKGRRPSWSAAARPQDAEPVVDAVVAALRERGATVETGEFGARMAVESVNDGPFTVVIET